MSDIYEKLEAYLNESDEDIYLPEEDIVLMDKMLDFISNLNTDNLTDDQVDEITGIIDSISDNDISEILEDDLDEAISAKKVKISPAEKRRRRMEYRKKRASIKMKAKKFRRTTKYKQWTRMKKRRAGQGKTARGKRIRKFL